MGDANDYSIMPISLETGYVTGYVYYSWQALWVTVLKLVDGNKQIRSGEEVYLMIPYYDSKCWLKATLNTPTY